MKNTETISYGAIIPLAKSTISKRSSNYKNTVIVLSLLIIVSIIFTFWQWSSKPLIGLFLFFPIYSIFLFLDYKEILDWKEKILFAWEKKAIEIGIVKDIINSIPNSPDLTIKSMLDTLPKDKKKPSLTKEKRKEIVKKQLQLHKLQKKFYIGGIIRSLSFFCLVYLTFYYSNVWILLGIIAIYSYKMIEINILRKQWDKIKKTAKKEENEVLDNLDQHPFYF